jgi:protein-tyrosine phosphatase
MKAEIYWIPEAKEGRLAIMPRPRSGEWLEDEVQAWRSAGVDMVVSLLTQPEIEELGLQEESRTCHAHGIIYISYPICDRHVPDSPTATIELIQTIRQALKQSKGIAIHCRMGIGRAAMIAAAILASQGKEVNASFDAIARARGLEVPDTDEQKAWVADMTKCSTFLNGAGNRGR